MASIDELIETVKRKKTPPPSAAGGGVATEAGRVAADRNVETQTQIDKQTGSDPAPVSDPRETFRGSMSQTDFANHNKPGLFTDDERREQFKKLQARQAAEFKRKQATQNSITNMDQ